jgi:DNA helicase-2/ATP-dependent DNA helicase PcrA
MTRARQHLNLMVPQRFYVTQQSGLGDQHMYASLTRFIPPELAGLFETVASCRVGSPDVLSSVPVADVASRLSARWA